MITPWKKVRSNPVGDFRIFKLRSDICINPRTGKEHDFYVLDTVGWVNVIALTPARELVMVQQYRVGSQTVELEIPGGMMDPGETDPVATAVRAWARSISGRMPAPTKAWIWTKCFS